MYSLTIFRKKRFSLTAIDDVIWYLDNGALTKKWSNGFSKSIAQTDSFANKISNYPRFEIVVVFSLSMMAMWNFFVEIPPVPYLSMLNVLMSKHEINFY